MDTRKYLAELVGTFLFMTIGYSSVAALGAGAGPLRCSWCPFSFGFGLLAAIFAVGHISGGHFNPAVTVAAVLDKRTETTDAIGYILAQVIGAIAAAAVVFVVAGQGAVAAGVTKPGAGISDIGALILEIGAHRRLRPCHPRGDEARCGPRTAGYPLDIGGDPFRLCDIVRRIGQPGAVDRVGAPGGRPGGPVDLPRRTHRRCHRRVGDLPPPR